MADKKKITILHINDNETTRYTVSRILKAEYEVKEAVTGAEALHTPPDQAPPGKDLVITGSITNAGRVKKARLRYRKVGDKNFEKVDMQSDGGDRYTAVIPASLMQPPGVEYFVVIQDIARQPHLIFASPESPARVKIGKAKPETGPGLGRPDEKPDVKPDFVSAEKLGANLNRHNVALVILSAVISSSLWVHFCNAYGLPISASHALIGGLVGARVFHILDFWEYYSANPGQIISLQLNGLAIYGGLVGGLVAVAGYAAWKKLSFWRLADVAAVGLPLGQAIGRVGCLINGCNYGSPTTLPWGVVWTNPGAMAPINDVARHPAQAYEALLSLAVFGLVWMLRKRFKTDGVLFLVYMVAYSIGRFPISLVREDTIALFGLRQAQVVGLAVIVLAVPLAYYLTRRRALQ